MIHVYPPNLNYETSEMIFDLSISSRFVVLYVHAGYLELFPYFFLSSFLIRFLMICHV